MAFDFSSNWNLIKSGDLLAFKKLFIEVSPSLINYSCQITRDRFLAEEVVQDVFVTIWQNRHQVEITASVKSYLYQTVHNFSVNKVLHQNAKKNAIGVLVSEDAWQTLEQYFHVDDFVIEKLEAQETESIINTIIEHLPDQCREIFKLSRFANLSNMEIAARLNISVSTVKTQIYRGLDKIRENLFQKK